MAKYKIDTILAKDQLQSLQGMVRDWGVAATMATLFWVLTKQQEQGTGVEASRLVPFRLKPIQADIEAKLGKNNIVGKPRQTGITTYLLLRRLLLPAITDGGIGSLLISQSSEYAGIHFAIARRAYRLVGVVDPFDATQNELSIALKNNLLHTSYSSRRELVFDYLDSFVRIASAEVEESGQGATLHHIHCSEYARWPGKPEATLANVRGALVPGGTVDKESTANGAAGPFFEDCMRALNTPKESDSVLFFYPHWWEPDYETQLTSKEKDELEADLTADEVRLIAKMHKDLSSVAYAPAA